MSSDNQNNKFCNQRSLLGLFSKIYISSLIYGLILIRNNKWVESNYILAIIIYSVIIIFCLITWFIFIKYNLYERGNNQNNSDNNIPWYQMININEISRAIISNFEIIERIDDNSVDSSDNLESIETKTCLICGEEYKKNDETSIKYIKLNCSHDFCEECISKWCNKKNSCPLCRLEILSESNIQYRNEIEV